MSDTETMLREVARRLLAEKSVDVVVGYAPGTLPLRTTPTFIRDSQEVERLVWNPSCENNLAKYVWQLKGQRVAVVAKGCDARALVNALAERQVSRDKLFIIGVPCHGVVDRAKVEERLGGRDLLAGRIEGETLVLDAEGSVERMALHDVLADGCLLCEHPNPPLSDILIGKTVEEAGNGQAPAQAVDLEAMTPDERWAYLQQEFSRCIRCYACRQACPNCYCPECFVDQSQPRWFPNSDQLADIMAFHLVRAYHMAGRCLECEACSRACPMHIDLASLLRILGKDVEERYHFAPGMDPEAAPALATFRADDPEEFIK